MTGEAWLTLLVILGLLIVLIRDVVPPAAAVAGAMIIVLVTGVVNPSQALSGFSNPAPLTVAALYVLARAVERTGALGPIVRVGLGRGDRTRTALSRLVFPTASASAFLNNTPVVAMLIPQVEAWAEENKRSPSLLLMPLSFAALLGGVVTVIGTSTNIVVSGLLVDAGSDPIGFFEIGAAGIPIAIGGAILLVILAPLLLKARRSVRQEAEEEAREFAVDMEVDGGGPLDGAVVETAGLRHMRSVFLATIERDGELIAPVSPDMSLRGGDRLRFVGKADGVLELQGFRGLSSAENPHMVDLEVDRPQYHEVVIGPQSRLVGNTLSEVGFRGRYQAVVVAIHRAGQRIDAKLGQVRLKVGDTLLLLADTGFRDRWRDRSDFLVISGGIGAPPIDRAKSVVVGLVALGIIGTSVSGLMPILEASLLGALLLVAFRVLTPGEALSSVDLNVIILIASAFGLAAAMDTSGLAEVAADAVISVFDIWGDVGIMLGIVIATVLLTGLITNNASALLMFPIAASTAVATGIDLRPLAIGVAIAASTNFLTPIGYQTNTMVYGPGGYRFLDYARLGIPLTIFVLVVVVLLVPIAWPL